MRMIVVLPQPDGPRIEKKDPAGTEKETLSTAVVSPNFFGEVGALQIGRHWEVL
jgi:hypothetical protein